MDPDVHILTGAYVLDALDEPERRRFETHLAACPDCALEVVELSATAARLGLAFAEQPPARLLARVLAEITRLRQDGRHDRGRAHDVVRRAAPTDDAR